MTKKKKFSSQKSTTYHPNLNELDIDKNTAQRFNSFNLDSRLLKGIRDEKMTFATNIQEEIIPLILNGNDVIGMARTGSGKTAAFLIPIIENISKIIEKYKEVDGEMESENLNSILAIIISPTRELAVQTFQTTKNLTKHFKNIRSTLIVGGKSLNEGFNSLINESPQIVVGTPGRLMHLLVEMNGYLKRCQFCVFDEGDRLFELGFSLHLKEILKRLPSASISTHDSSIQRQTMIFSATMPKELIELSSADLIQPKIVRLNDQELISKQIHHSYIYVRDEDKLFALSSIVSNLTELKKNAQIIIFVATKYHVEVIKDFLIERSFVVSYIYSQLDDTARQVQMKKFRMKLSKILIVTDIAARGIHIPKLDFCINYHFPSQPKLFVHRVGRVGRAGNKGTTFSLCSNDELPYVFDLHFFLNITKELETFHQSQSLNEEETKWKIGTIPQHLLDNEHHCNKSFLEKWKSQIDLSNNGMKQYINSRTNASKEAHVEAKKFIKNNLENLTSHFIFRQRQEINTDDSFTSDDEEEKRNELLKDISSFKGKSNIFEIKNVSSDSSKGIMKKKREKDDKRIWKHSNRKLSEQKEKKCTEDILVPSIDLLRKKADEQNRFFLSYKSKDNEHLKKGLRINSVNEELKKSEINFSQDTNDNSNVIDTRLHWDRKRKKFIRKDQTTKNQKFIKLDSGSKVNVSYQTGAFQKWKKQQQNVMSDGRNKEIEDLKSQIRQKDIGIKGKTKVKDEVKSAKFVIKTREKKEKREKLETMRRNKNKQRKENRSKNDQPKRLRRK
ncbi:hypothetical protein SNEBB_004605 [Seison nebaliae]|nr:hypothetical protein SNEBB_004605 [Seison nebaliae]